MGNCGNRNLTIRASSAVKERRCAVTETFLVTAWVPILLLLLISSVGQRDDQDQAFSLTAINAQEITSGSLVGRHSVLSEGGNSDSRDDCRTDSIDELDVDIEKSANSKILDATNDEWIPRPSAIASPSVVTLLGSRDAIDALHYAEYGAGLLQKKGPEEESFNLCLVKDASGPHWQIISRYGELTRQKCPTPQTSSSHKELACLDGYPLDDICFDASSFGADVVAEIDPGVSQLVCQSDFLTGAVFCEIACTSISECFLFELESELYLDDVKLRGLIGHTCQWEQAVKLLEPGSTLSSSPIEIFDSGNEKVLQFPSQSTHESHVDRLTSEADVDNESGLGPYVEQQNGDTLGEELADFMTATSERKVLNTNEGDPAFQASTDSNLDESSDVIDIKETTNIHLDDSSRMIDIAESADIQLENMSMNVELPRDYYQTTAEFEVGIELDEDIVASQVTSEQDTKEEPGRLKRVGSVMNLEDYRRSILEKQQMAGNEVNLSNVQNQRLRHSDGSYNYAAAAYGAKVLASNKEAKGVTNILSSDKDKYLRNPCGAEDKFVVLELSEETFVDTIVISNFEFHSSNLKDFELLGSPVYPTKEWISLGKFQAENVKHRQTFDIADPILVRYVMLRMLSQWGSEFFCTLSSLELFGVDVIKNLLDDWKALEEVESNGRKEGTNGHVPQEENAQQETDEGLAALEHLLLNEAVSELGTSSDPGRGKAAEKTSGDENTKVGSTGDLGQDFVHIQGGKTPGDSVLKILMQRVKALELNQSLFDLYLGDMNQKYRAMLLELDKDLAIVTERLRNETALTASLAMQLSARELQRKEEKLYVEHQFALIASNFTDTLDFMRWQVESLERREIAAVVMTLLCMILSALLHFLGSCMRRKVFKQDMSGQANGKTMDGELEIHSLQSIFNSFSTFVLYFASGLTILVLSV